MTTLEVRSAKPVNGEPMFVIGGIDLGMAHTLIDALTLQTDRILMEIETYRRRERSGLAFENGNWRTAGPSENTYRSAEDIMFLGNLLGEVNKLIFLLRDETKDI